MEEVMVNESVEAIEKKREAPDKLTTWDIIWCYLRFNCAIWLTQSNVNRAGTALTDSIGKILKKLYKNKEDFNEALSRHMEFYMTEYTWGACILGLTIAMEEQRAKDLYENGYTNISPSGVSAIKSSLMGPFAGIGDTLWSAVFWALGLAFTIPMAMEGNFWAVPIAWFVCEGVQYPIGALMTWYGYSKGKSFVAQLTNSKMFNKVLTLAGIMSMVVFGGLTGSLVSFSTPGLLIGERSFTNFLDSVIPGISVLGPLFLMYFLGRKRKISVPVIIVSIVIVCVILGMLGVFTDPQAVTAMISSQMRRI